MAGPYLRRVIPFAVSPHEVQIVWGDAFPGPVLVTLEGRRFVVQHGGGPGGLVIDGLTPATSYQATVRPAHSTASAQVSFVTLSPPPGPELGRVVTVSDLHIGAWRHGLLRPMIDRSGHQIPHATRCAQAALAEADRFHPDLVVVKGDLTNHGWHGHWNEVASILHTVSQPLAIAPGNHDVGEVSEDDAARALAIRGLPCADPISVTDLPGVRVIVLDSTVPGHSEGQWAKSQEALLDAAAEADRPCLVCLHHPPERWPIPSGYPIGIPWPASAKGLAALRRAQPRLLVTAGHTHRNRRYRLSGVEVSEVASTKDYPGVWAGYAIHEGGIRQVVQRTLAPEAMAWTEQTRQTMGGIWGRYSPGTLSDRCFVHRW